MLSKTETQATQYRGAYLNNTLQNTISLSLRSSESNINSVIGNMKKTKQNLGGSFRQCCAIFQLQIGAFGEV